MQGLWYSFYVCVGVSVTTLAAAYLICESKVQLCKVPCGVPNALYCMNFAKNALFSTFADVKLLDFLSW